MPVTKSSPGGSRAKSIDMYEDNRGGLSSCFHMGDFGRKIFSALLGIFLVYLIFFLGTLIRNNLVTYDTIGKADKMERTITIDGQGKVTVKPDIGMTTIGMLADGKTVAEAQKKNTDVMNKLIDRLKGLGIDSKDIQTSNYNIYPQYNYTEKTGRELLGYEVQQQVSVKIRDLAKSSDVLALAGEVGANSVGGLQFTIDDPEVYKAQARQIALDKAAEKARLLAKELGLHLGNVVSYYESEGGGMFPMYKASNAMDMSIGGEAAPAPSVESGSTDVIMNVQVVFDIR